MKEISLKISDIDCAACVEPLNRAISAVNGVRDAAVNYASGRALISYDEDEASIASMKDGVILINTARGTAIDEQALAKALLSGKIKTACLDVYDPEPPCADNPLLKLDNCIMTPHIAGQAANGLQRIGYNCYCQLLHFLAGERMQGEITRDMLNHIA